MSGGAPLQHTSAVDAGLVPATPSVLVQSLNHWGGRDESGHDTLTSGSI